MLLLSKRSTRTALLLVLQAGKSGFVLLALGNHLVKPDLKTVAANPQDNGACGHHPSCLGNTFCKKVLATSGLKTFVPGTLVKKMLGGMH